MADNTEPSAQTPLCIFKDFVQAICSQFNDTDAILTARREGLTGPRSVRVFICAFEAVITLSTRTAVKEKIQPLLERLANIISFRLPLRPPNVVALNGKNEADTQEVLDSLARCLGQAIACSMTIPPSSEILEREFRRCQEAWESESISFDIIAPIAGLALDQNNESTDCGDFRITGPWALGEYLQYRLIEHRQDLLDIPSPTVLVSQKAIAKHDDQMSFVRKAAGDVTRCITALRIATGALVSCSIMHVVVSAPYLHSSQRLPNYVWRLPDTSVEYNFLRPAYQYSKDDIAMTRHVAALLSSPFTSWLEIALERFVVSGSRNSPEDQIIDMAIALESTLGRTGVRDQLSYRFRLFGAAVLADRPQLGDAMTWLKLLYDARSSIVHGGKRLGRV